MMCMDEHAMWLRLEILVVRVANCVTIDKLSPTFMQRHFVLIIESLAESLLLAAHRSIIPDHAHEKIKDPLSRETD